jgi:hypothetical protein
MNSKNAKKTPQKICENKYRLSNSEILTRLLKSWRQKLSCFSMFAALPAVLTSLAPENRAEETMNPADEPIVAGQIPKRLTGWNKRNNSILAELLAGGDNCPGSAIPGGTYRAAAPYTDTGSTADANNTVSRLAGYYYYSYPTEGLDHIYTFSLSGRGPNPQILVTSGLRTYDPMIYILNSEWGPCPNGTNQIVSNWFGIAYPSESGGTAAFNADFMNSLPLNVPLYLFIDSPQIGGAGPYTLRLEDVTVAPAAPPRANFDFDGDGKADFSVFRPSDNSWYMKSLSSGFSSAPFGLASDKIIPGDFDGDRKTDIAVYRDGFWYWLNSSDRKFNAVPFGIASDIPVPADFTGDGRAELAVYRDGIWWMLDLSNNQVKAVYFGLPTDKPVTADYDGDGKSDQAVYRDGIWHLNRSRDGYTALQFGLATDKPVVGDYDGDGKADAAVYRDGFWYFLRSQAGFSAFKFGDATDVPVPADYDGDWRTDVAVFRNGIWYLFQSRNGFTFIPFGLESDRPIPSVYLP